MAVLKVAADEVLQRTRMLSQAIQQRVLKLTESHSGTNERR
jgi:hypothetical protein